MQVDWRVRLKYRFDQMMSAGAVAQIVALGVLTVVVLSAVFCVIVATNLNGDLPPLTVAYHELLETLDPGTVAGFDDGHWWFAFLSVCITFYGIFVVGALIGILSNAIDQRLQDLRKGRSTVVESGHIVILGWSSEIFTILRQLCAANANRRQAVIVVLAPRDKVEMEDAIRNKLGDTGVTRVVCRTGDPLDIDDLGLVSLETCDAIIILTPDHEADRDAVVLKTLLAVHNAAVTDEAAHHIVVELRDRENLGVARIAGGEDVLFLLTADIAAKVIVQACRQPGLSAIFAELLDYQGSEVYLVDIPELAGATFGSALDRFDTSILLGIYGRQGLELNPPRDRVIEVGDRCVVIAEDDDTAHLDAVGATPVDEAAIKPVTAAAGRGERTLVLGFNDELAGIIEQLDSYVAPGSELVIACTDVDHVDEALAAVQPFHALTVRHQPCDPTKRRHLDLLGIPSFDHVVILSDMEADAEHADARTLTTLLHVRDIETRAGVDVNVVSEMRVERNKDLAQSSTDDDFIVSSQLLSLFIAQVVMTPELLEIFDELLSADHVKVSLRPMGDYVELGREMTFATAAAAAARRSEIALGYRADLRAGAMSGPMQRSLVMNPPKSSVFCPRVSDQLIVLRNRALEPWTSTPSRVSAGIEGSD